MLIVLNLICNFINNIVDVNYISISVNCYLTGSVVGFGLSLRENGFPIKKGKRKKDVSNGPSTAVIGPQHVLIGLPIVDIGPSHILIGPSIAVIRP